MCLLFQNKGDLLYISHVHNRVHTHVLFVDNKQPVSKFHVLQQLQYTPQNGRRNAAHVQHHEHLDSEARKDAHFARLHRIHMHHVVHIRVRAKMLRLAQQNRLLQEHPQLDRSDGQLVVLL